MSDEIPATRVTCPQCVSRLELLDTQSGGRTVSVIHLGLSVEQDAAALERFVPPGVGPDVICPACRARFDPAVHHRIVPPLPRRHRD